MNRITGKHRLINILHLLIIMVLTSCIHDDEWVEHVSVGDCLPRFSVTLDDGGCYDSSIAGASVIVFFHTACVDCREELPLLDARYRAGEFAGRRVVCISRAESSASVAAFWREHHLTLPYSAQADRRIFDLFASAGIPRIYETDNQGIVVRITKAE